MGCWSLCQIPISVWKVKKLKPKILNFVDAMQIAEIIMSKPLPANFGMEDVLDSLTIHEILKIGEFVSILPRKNQGIEYINLIQKELAHQNILDLCKSYSLLIGVSNAPR